MQWQITISDGNGSETKLTAESPVKAVKELMFYSIQHDFTDRFFYDDCFNLIEEIQDEPQDEYRVRGRNFSTPWYITLKPVPAVDATIETKSVDQPKAAIEKALKALRRFQSIIESTYAHDENGERDDDEESEFSSADIFEFVCEEESNVKEALEALEELALESPASPAVDILNLNPSPIAEASQS